MTDQRELVAHPRGTERPYSRAAVFAGTIWACGQIPTTADGQTPAAIGDQVKVALDNLEATLLASGGGLHTLLKTTVYLADLSEFDEYNAAYLDRLEGDSTTAADDRGGRALPRQQENRNRRGCRRRPTN